MFSRSFEFRFFKIRSFILPSYFINVTQLLNYEGFWIIGGKFNDVRNARNAQKIKQSISYLKDTLNSHLNSISVAALLKIRINICSMKLLRRNNNC